MRSTVRVAERGAVRGARPAAALSLSALLCPLVAGCYHVGVVPPPRVTRVAIPFFRNDTFPLERGLEFDLTRAVRQRLEEQTTCVLVSDPESADAVLEGTLKSYSESIQAEDPLDRPIRSVAIAQVHVRFQRTGPGGEVFFDETFPPERVSFVAGSARNAAKEELVRRISDRILAWAFTTWEEP